jgi:membrane-associated protease RseP (regulator of RpoE activity)
MSQDFKIWKISLLLLLGLLISLYLIVSTVADAYWVITNPVAGVEYEFDSDLNRMVIRRVVPEGPADLNGLRANDVILTFNQKPIFSESELNEAYGNIKVGQRVDLTISRDNQEFNISFVAESTRKGHCCSCCRPPFFVTRCVLSELLFF